MTSLLRWRHVARQEFVSGLRKPAYWILFGVLALLAWGFSTGSVTISTGESIAGGARPHVTSVFNQSMIQVTAILGIGAWFLTIAAGMIMPREAELQVEEVLGSTPLTPGEYVWGKFTGALGVFFAGWILFLCVSIGFNHVVAPGGEADHIGPFVVWNYLFPTLLFAVPQVLFFAGAPFFLGTWTRRAIVVFAFPVVVLLLTMTLLAFWSPSWLDPSVNRALMLADPSGFRWLNETFLKVDRGVEFYNTAPLRPDAGFLLSRVAFALAGLAAVAAAQRSVARRMRAGTSAPSFRLFRRRTRPQRGASEIGHTSAAPEAATQPSAVPAADQPFAAPATAASTSTAGRGLADLGMTSRPPRFWRTVGVVGGSEVRELLVRPGMYLFVPLILYQSIFNLTVSVGPFDSRILLTPGAAATRQINTLALLVCLILLFYTVESLYKERGRRLAEIFNATPIGTGAMLLGKTLGNSVVAALILTAAFFATAGLMGYQRLFEDSPVGFSVVPFLAAWGAVLIPTFVFWTAFATALFSVFRSRYAAYGAGLGVVVYTVYRASFEGNLPWTLNWIAWDALQWSDMGAFSLHGGALMLNRLFFLSLATLLVAVSVACFGRRDFDAAQLVHRFRPKPLFMGFLRSTPFLALPAVLGATLYFGGRSGYEGPAAEDAAEDYWRRNAATWTDFKMPSVSHVEMELEFEPRRRSVEVSGAYTFFNHRDYAYDRVPVTAGVWDPIQWTLDGEEHEPDDRSGLFVFQPAAPLEPGDSLTIGFSYELQYLKGTSRTAGGEGQFILSSGIVLGTFTPTFAPVPGYLEDVGRPETPDSKEYADDFFEGETEPLFGWGGEPFTTRVRITTPEEYTANSVGRKTSEEVVDGRRTVVWESDHPVGLLNVVAGRYAVKEGEGTAIYYHPEHDYNVDEMSAALDAARRHYSEWFYPFPWETLKLSEFPGFATYAQGFPTNITFSEGIGFLAKSDPRSHIAFMVVAHEAAHQWWGNLLTPGQGPGGNVLSEGMAHYATMLLHEEVHGERYRIEFAKRIEELYGDGRFVDSERPLTKIDGSRSGDGTVTYDKGGWVMWMLQQEIGRENLLAGLRAFIAKYNPDPDFPVLQDMLAVLRGFAPDTAALDAFADQWFFDVVAPEYWITDASREQIGNEWVVRGTLENVGTGRMAVDVAAVAGERWPDDGGGAGNGERTGSGQGNRSGQGNEDNDGGEGNQDGAPASQAYQDAHTVVEVGGGESATFEIRSPFEPERLVVDPDVLILQLNRNAAVFEFEG